MHRRQNARSATLEPNDPIATALTASRKFQIQLDDTDSACIFCRPRVGYISPVTTQMPGPQVEAKPAMKKQAEDQGRMVSAESGKGAGARVGRLASRSLTSDDHKLANIRVNGRIPNCSSDRISEAVDSMCISDRGLLPSRDE
jgi:hypothetical protein